MNHPITDEEILNVLRVHNGDRSLMEVIRGLFQRIQQLQRRVEELETESS